MNAALGRAALVLAAVTSEPALLATLAMAIVLMAYVCAQLVVQPRPTIVEYACAPAKQATVDVSTVPALASAAVPAPATVTAAGAAAEPTTTAVSAEAAAATKRPFQKGDRVQYLTTARKWAPATVVSVHLMGGIAPEYHIRVDGSSLEKHTEADRLRGLIAQNRPPAAPARASATAAAATKRPFQKGDRVQYFTAARKWAPAAVVSVHMVGGIVPEYHIKVDGSSLEKHTEAQKLRWPQASARATTIFSTVASAATISTPAAAAARTAGTHKGFQKGDRVEYFTAAKKWVPATVVSVYLYVSGIDPEYHIVADGSSLEKHTEAGRLR